MERLILEIKSEKELFDFLCKNKKRKCINFLNQHDIYQLVNTPLFSFTLKKKNNLNLIDGFFISLFLSIKNLRKIRRKRGPTFTRDFLSNKSLSENKKHFFVGLEKKDLILLKKKFPHLKYIDCYNPPYIKDVKFSEKEIKKIARLINKFEAEYVWMCIASPKQNILAQDLFPITKTKYFFNVGAALDFILGKKREAPKFIQILGLEWFFRLITDFKYSKIKVWRSFVAVFYLLSGKVKLELRK